MTVETHDQIVTRWYQENAEKQLQTTYPAHAQSFILDVGAYHGKWALEMFQKYRCGGIAIEPVTEAYQIAQRNLASTRIGVEHCALAGHTGLGEIACLEDGSSFHQKSEKTQAVALYQLADFFYSRKYSEVPQITVCKMNVEGAEFEILENLMSDNILSHKIDNLQIQWHPVVDQYQARRAEISKFLSRTHELTYCFDWVWENWRRK